MIRDIMERFCRAKNRKKEKPEVLALTSLVEEDLKILETPFSTKGKENNATPEPPQDTPDEALTGENPSFELPDEDSDSPDTTAIFVIQLNKHSLINCNVAVLKFNHTPPPLSHWTHWL